MNNQNYEKLSKPIAFSNERVCLEELRQKEHKHFHPSGLLLPSKEDTMLTDKMVKLCALMGIPLLDHIIVGGDNSRYFSFREKELITNPNHVLNTDYHKLDLNPPMAAEKGKAR